MIGYITTNRVYAGSEQQFKHAAETLAEQLGALLCADTSVVDARGVVVASSEPQLIGQHALANRHLAAPERLRISMHINGCSGEVIVGESHTGEHISSRLAQALVEQVIRQNNTVRHLAHQHELKNSLVADLLYGMVEDEAVVMREARVLGMDFGAPRAVILIDASHYILPIDASAQRDATDVQIRRRAQFVISCIVSFFHLPNDTICAYIGDGHVAVLKASNSKNLCSWVEHSDGAQQVSSSWMNLNALRRASEDLLARLSRETGSQISIGIGRHYPGIPGLARSFQEAKVALSLGCRFLGTHRIHCLDRLGIAAFIGVADERTKVDLATYLLRPLDCELELLETLHVFFSEDCSPNATAARLSIHRNTLSYRLDKITSLTGLNPRKFDDAVQIRLALLMRAFNGAGS